MANSPATFFHRRPRPIRLVGLACAVAVGIGLADAPAARAADRIGEKLPAEAVRVLKYLKREGLRNVGVLKFRVKKGDRPETFNVGPLNAVITREVENALVLQNRDGGIGIISQAGKVGADRKERLSYLTADGCDKLFKLKYPLAWGTSVVSPDAFITGVVRISPSRATTTVVIEVIAKGKMERKKVTEFTVRTERTILNDICDSFVVNRGNIQRAGPKSDPDEEAVEQAGNRRKPARADKLVQLRISYSGEEQTVRTHPTRRGEYRVATPREGQKVTLVVENLSNQEVAVVLGVNGKNTALGDEDTETPAACTKWVLKARGTAPIRGWYNADGKTHKPFGVLSEESSAQLEELDPNPRLGAIQLFVFVASDIPHESAAGLRKALPTGKNRPRTPAGAAKQIRLNRESKVRRAGLILPGLDEAAAPVVVVPYANRQQQFAQVIRYYHGGRKGPAPKLKKERR